MYSFVVSTPYKRNSLSAYPVNTDFNIQSENDKKTHNKRNVFVSLAGKELDFILTNDAQVKYHKICQCNNCRSEMVSLAVSKLPEIYIFDENKIESTVNDLSKKYEIEINKAVYESIKKVKNNPSENCQNIKNNKSVAYFNNYTNNNFEYLQA